MLDGIDGSFGFERLLERLDARVRGRLGEVDLGAAAPHHHEPFETVLVLEPPDVVPKLFGEITFVAAPS